ncbi:F-box domain containing protein [Tanacetum coccineum]
MKMPGSKMVSSLPVEQDKGKLREVKTERKSNGTNVKESVILQHLRKIIHFPFGQPKKKKKAKKDLFTIYFHYDEIALRLVPHGCFEKLYYCQTDVKLNLGLTELRSNQDIGDMLKVGYENGNAIDMYVEHFGYDIMEMAQADRNEEQNQNSIESSDDDYNSSDCEEIENVDFQTEGDESVVIKDISTSDPFLNKLCSARIMFRGMRYETPQQLKLALANYGVANGYQLWVENADNWGWFLHLLHDDLSLNDGNGITIISDSHKGLIDAVNDWLPEAEHRKCTRHIYANFKKKYSGLQYQRLFWAAASCTLEQQFVQIMDQIKQLHEGAYDYLIQRNPNSWSRAFFEMAEMFPLEEFSESFNRAILIPRHKPIITMLEEIRLYIMQRLAAMNKCCFLTENGLSFQVASKSWKLGKEITVMVLISNIRGRGRGRGGSVNKASGSGMGGIDEANGSGMETSGGGTRDGGTSSRGGGTKLDEEAFRECMQEQAREQAKIDVEQEMTPTDVTFEDIGEAPAMTTSETTDVAEASMLEESIVDKGKGKESPAE